ncbi:hypothetical protein Taro_017192 [Colocasia esculenta]|uniref:Uncharacterized protein n=1 Tax=Colocasia esculenta TaxID=4460 RepID=A0A843UMX7_COLES|nr:hypothetical protein [Colocasia esculenta]
MHARTSQLRSRQGVRSPSKHDAPTCRLHKYIATERHVPAVAFTCANPNPGGTPQITTPDHSNHD